MKRLAYNDLVARAEVRINMSPLIDVVFLLLIFFVVTTTFVEETGIEVQRPRAVSARQLDKDSILIALTRDGRIVHGGREVRLNGLRGHMARQLQDGPLPIVVVADAEAKTGLLVDVVDECKLAGATQVSVAARHENEDSPR